MPLSNFSVTTGGQGPGILDFLALATGNTAKQRAQAKLDNFVENELPQFATGIFQAKTAKDLQPHMVGLFQAGMKAGISPDALGEFAQKYLIGPAKAGMGADQVGEIARQLQPQTTISEKPVSLPPIEGPFGRGLEQFDQTAPELTTTPGRPFSQADALKLGEIEARTGVKPPSGLSSLIAAPSTVAQREAESKAAMELASRRKTQRQLEERQIETLEGLPEEEIGDTGMSARTLGLATKGGGLSALATESRREAAQAPVRESQVTLNKARTNQANAQADRARQLAKQVGGAAKVGTLYNEYSRLFGDPANDPDGPEAGNDKFLTWAERRSRAVRKQDFADQLLNRGGAGSGAAPAKGRPSGKLTAQSVLEKYGVR